MKPWPFLLLLLCYIVEAQINFQDFAIADASDDSSEVDYGVVERSSEAIEDTLQDANIKTDELDVNDSTGPGLDDVLFEGEMMPLSLTRASRTFNSLNDIFEDGYQRGANTRHVVGLIDDYDGDFPEEHEHFDELFFINHYDILTKKESDDLVYYYDQEEDDDLIVVEGVDGRPELRMRSETSSEVEDFDDEFDVEEEDEEDEDGMEFQGLTSRFFGGKGGGRGSGGNRGYGNRGYGKPTTGGRGTGNRGKPTTGGRGNLGKPTSINGGKGGGRGNRGGMGTHGNGIHSDSGSIRHPPPTRRTGLAPPTRPPPRRGQGDYDHHVNRKPTWHSGNDAHEPPRQPGSGKPRPNGESVREINHPNRKPTIHSEHEAVPDRPRKVSRRPSTNGEDAHETDNRKRKPTRNEVDDGHDAIDRRTRKNTDHEEGDRPTRDTRRPSSQGQEVPDRESRPPKGSEIKDHPTTRRSGGRRSTPRPTPPCRSDRCKPGYKKITRGKSGKPKLLSRAGQKARDVIKEISEAVRDEAIEAFTDAVKEEIRNCVEEAFGNADHEADEKCGKFFKHITG